MSNSQLAILFLLTYKLAKKHSEGIKNKTKKLTESLFLY